MVKIITESFEEFVEEANIFMKNPLGYFKDDDWVHGYKFFYPKDMKFCVSYDIGSKWVSKIKPYQIWVRIASQYNGPDGYHPFAPYFGTMEFNTEHERDKSIVQLERWIKQSVMK